MKDVLIGLVSAIVLTTFASTSHAEPSFSGKDRQELYDVIHQQAREARGYRYHAQRERDYYNEPREQRYGYYEQYRPYGENGYYRGRRYPG